MTQYSASGSCASLGRCVQAYVRELANRVTESVCSIGCLHFAGVRICFLSRHLSVFTSLHCHPVPRKNAACTASNKQCHLFMIGQQFCASVLRIVYDEGTFMSRTLECRYFHTIYKLPTQSSAAAAITDHLKCMESQRRCNSQHKAALWCHVVLTERRKKIAVKEQHEPQCSIEPSSTRPPAASVLQQSSGSGSAHPA